MALIEYNIGLDATGKTTVVSTIQRIDPGDEILVVSDTPQAALQWTAGSPFAVPAAGDVYPLPASNASSQPLRVTRLIDSAQDIALCGEQDGAGNFTPWVKGGGGFPPVGPTTRSGSDS